MSLSEVVDLHKGQHFVIYKLSLGIEYDQVCMFAMANMASYTQIFSQDKSISI